MAQIKAGQASMEKGTQANKLPERLDTDGNTILVFPSGPVLGEAPLEIARELVRRYNEYEGLVRLREVLEWVRQTVHRAHHDGPLEGCPKNTCDAAIRALSASEASK